MKYYPMKLIGKYPSRLEAVMSLGCTEEDAQLKIIESAMERSELMVMEREDDDGERLRFAVASDDSGRALVWAGRPEIAFDDPEECQTYLDAVSKKFKKDTFAVISSSDPASKERH